MATPFVSIVTVTFNAGAHLAQTIESVLGQTHRPIEYVIVDGGSHDNTLDIVRQYEGRLSQWISAPDRGIYDAMNKSLGLVTGDWVNFMNAGDTFAHPESVAQAMANVPENAEVVYGSYEIAYESFKKRKTAPNSLTDFHRGMIINHQSTFVRTATARAHPFDPRYPLAADFAQLFKLYCAGAVFHRADNVVAHFADGGVSAARKVEYLRQCLAVVQELRPDLWGTTAHYQKAIRQTERIAQLRATLPNWLFEGLMQLKSGLWGTQ